MPPTASSLPLLWRLLQRGEPLSSGALSNARTACRAMALETTDRRALTDGLVPEDGEPAPGELVALGRSECLRLLATRSVGRLAYVAREAEPMIVPVTYALDGDEVLVRSGPGPKLQAAERGDVVAFEVDAVDEVTRTGWSVVVTGRAERWRDGRADGRGPVPWAGGPRSHVIRIAGRRITGRRLA